MGHHVKQLWKRHSRSGALYRAAVGEYVIEDCGPHITWRARDKFRVDADIFVSDYDDTKFRGRRSTGWKNNHFRKQWEHNVVNGKKRKK